MPPLESLDRHQYALLWEKVPKTEVQYDNYGEPIVRDPIQILVRWNDGRNETVDQQGATIAYDATVVVDRDIPIGSMMWLGRKQDYRITDTKLQVIHVSTTPDLKNRNYRREVFLSRLHDTELGTSA